jgi:hypothetical protein
MMGVINLAANSMIGEAALPNFLVAADQTSQFMRVRSFDQLDGPLDRHVVRWRQQKMDMFGHDNESVQAVTAFVTIPIKRFQEDPHIDFDGEQFSAVESRERHEVSPRRREESSRLQEQTSAAGSRASFPTLNRHEWNSRPSRLFFLRGFSFWEEPGRLLDSVLGETVI